MNSNKTVVIIDDHPMFREGLRTIIEKNERYTVIGEAGTGSEGIRMVSGIKPDIVIVDISLPDKNGIHVAKDIAGLNQQTRVLVVSMHSKIDYVTDAMRSGAFGYIIKESAPETLLKGLDAISKGEYFLDPSLSEEIIVNIIGFSAKVSGMSDTAYQDLTSREQEIMRMLVQGWTAKEIADRLCISPKTVENHRTNIMNKLGVHRTVELIRYAVRIGLIDIDKWKE